MADISGFGIVVALTATNTFPAPLLITQFADDTDPLESGPIDIADKAMGLNGDPIYWAKANLIPMTLGVIPGQANDLELQVLSDNNRVGPGKVGANDVINATITYPDGTVIILGQGRLVSAPAVKSVSSSGRLKSRVYGFVFASKIGG